MRRAVPAVAAASLLAGATILAFYSGGFFIDARLVAAIVAWLLVLALTLVGPAPLPQTLPGWLALAGLVLVTAWSALSVTWAPVQGPAVENVQRLVLYVGAFVLAIGALRHTRAMRAVEPALVAGATIVIAYGLAGRLVPGIVHLAHSVRAGGRLEQPITYWNAEGAIAAVGLVLCARLAGDRTRPVALRALAAAAAAPLGVGVYLSYSRGAIAAAALGLIILVAAAPSRSQLEASGVLLAAALPAAVCASLLPGVASVQGNLGAREQDGALMLVILVLLAAAAAVVTVRRTRAGARRSPGEDELPGSNRLAAIAAVAVLLGMVGLVVGGLQERSAPAAGRTNITALSSRLTSVSSNRYQYWRVALRAFGRHPIEGLGSAGFRVFWRRERSIDESVQEVHSLELEIAAELGIVGLLALGLMVAGVGMAGRDALRVCPTLAAGPCAASVAWLLHASIDWDWQLPAVTLPAIVLSAALIVSGEIGETG
jgi:O-Antigen ligase